MLVSAWGRWSGIAAAGLLAAGTAQAVETEQMLTGELLIEGINQNNYTDGSDDANDRAAAMWIRAKIGAKVDFDDYAELELSLVYDGQAGDYSGIDQDDSAEVAFNDAFLTLKHLFRDDFHMRIGRQPVSWNLRSDYGAFYHDSRADDPLVTSWDGVRAYWQNTKVTASAFWYILDEAVERKGIEVPVAGAKTNSGDNDLIGIMLDYQPDADGDNRLFFTGGATMELNQQVEPGLEAKELIAYYAGFEANLTAGIDLYGEGVFQDGELRNGNSMTGWGFNLGADYRPPGPMDTIIGVQFDMLSGDGDPNDGEYEAFSAPWEGVSDTLIVEHERYGELSELQVGNLQALKLKFEYRFMQERFRVKMMGAHYQMPEKVNNEDTFGTEVDFEINWQYTYWVNFGFMAAAFLPDTGYQEVVRQELGTVGGDDEIYFLGGTAQVVF
ncbi:MAG: alginate export family protein [Planctomycetota bacterium]|jgi:hypothetical protein|nr:alginate export family protein [Planctomycetota bacterium]